MARNEIVIGAPPAAVWDTLSDARSYGHWVVGSSEIRDADDGFPATGTRFHHRVGFGPFKIADHTEVQESAAPRHLKLRARARPAGTAVVVLDLFDHERGTRVVMQERPGDPLTALVFNAITDPLVCRRNDESLRRLRDMVEGRGPSLDQAASA